MPIEIVTRTGREAELWKILKTWKETYPKKFRFFKHALENMRQVQKNADGSFVDRKGRETHVSFRAPTELWLFIQHRIPGFGQDYSDVELLLKTAGDFFKASTLRRPRHKIGDDKKRDEKKTDEDISRDDSKGFGREAAEVYPVFT